jgi:hypothetical protein
MGTKRFSIRSAVNKKKEARRRQRRRETLAKARSMTDAELHQLAGEAVNDSLHVQARKVLAARQEARRMQIAAKKAALPAKPRERTPEPGSAPPVSGDSAQPDWWREE